MKLLMLRTSNDDDKTYNGEDGDFRKKCHESAVVLLFVKPTSQTLDVKYPFQQLSFALQNLQGLIYESLQNKDISF